jgi:hypothetical protein
MAAYNKFQPFVENLAEKVFNLGSDTLKVALTNSAPVNTYNQLSSVTQIAGTGGYTTGGTAATISSSAQTSGTYKLVLADVVFTSTGTLGPFQYAVLYDDTATNDELIGWWDYGSAVTLASSGDTFTVDFDASTGVLTIA